MDLLTRLKGDAFPRPDSVFGALLAALVFAAAAWLIGWLLRFTVQRVLQRDKHDHIDRMAVRFFAKLLRYAVYAAAFVAYTHYIPAFASLGTASLTSISVITVVVGLAAQNTLGNLVAGLALLLYRPFKLGDRLQVMAPSGLETGTVESLTLGYTLLRTDDSRRVVVPNSVMAGQTTINLTGDDPRVVCSIQVSIGFNADIDHCRAALLALAAAHPAAGRVVACPLVQAGSAGLVLSLDVWCADALTALTLRTDLLEQAIKHFAHEGLTNPFASRTLLLKRWIAPTGPLVPAT